MKFRSDFVTNSSSSNYISYNIKNKKLYDYIESLGIKINSPGDGILDSGMELVLPSGLVGRLDDSGEISYGQVASITDFVVDTIEQSIISDYPEPDEPPEDWTEYEDEMIEKYREELSDLLRHFRGSNMDGDIEYAHVENEAGFEGEYRFSEVIEVKNGIKTVKIPTESLFTGEAFNEDNFDGWPGKTYTQRWINGRWS